MNEDDPHLTSDESQYNVLGAMQEIGELAEHNPLPDSPEGLRLRALIDRLEGRNREIFLANLAGDKAPIAAKLILQVSVGLSPELLISERCRAWTYTSDDCERDLQASAQSRMPIFQRLCNSATEYARAQMDPASTNFVRLDWIWL